MMARRTVYSVRDHAGELVAEHVRDDLPDGSKRMYWRRCSLMDGSALDRFFKKIRIDSETGCWLWTGTTRQDGYGRFWLNGRDWRAHRASFLHFKGPLEHGYEPDHLCRRRHCVFYGHLEAVTQRENVLRGESFAALNARKVSCIHGHDEWAIARVSGWRYCKACHRISQAKINARTSGQRRVARERRKA